MTQEERNERRRRERDKIRVRTLFFGADSRFSARARTEREQYKQQHNVRLHQAERDIYGDEQEWGE